MNKKSVNILSAVLEPLVRPHYSCSLNYHNYDHIKKILSVVAVYSDEINRLYPAFDWINFLHGVVWHDAGFSPASRINEYIAARRFEEAFGGGDQVSKETVVELILSTRSNTSVFSTPEQQVLHDMDYAGFLFAVTAKHSTESIISEYYLNTCYEYPEVVEGRRKFLESLLSKDQIYVSGVFGPDATKTAKENIEKDLSRFDKLLEEGR